MATRCGGLQLVRSSLPGARSVAQYRSTLTGSSAPNALLNVRLPRAAHRRVEARVFDKLKKMWGDGPPPGGDGSGPQGTGSQEEDGEEDGEMIPLSSEESVGMAGDGGVFGPLVSTLGKEGGDGRRAAGCTSFGDTLCFHLGASRFVLSAEGRLFASYSATSSCVRKSARLADLPAAAVQTCTCCPLLL